MKKVVSKGYTLEVTSWENDGDNYRTKDMTFPTKEKALAVKHLCKNVFVSSSNGKGGIGNLMADEYEKASNVILNYLEEFPSLIKSIEPPKENEYYDDHCVDVINEYNYNLMGSSEYYCSRVYESCVLYYSDKDIFVEEVEEK